LNIILTLSFAKEDNLSLAKLMVTEFLF